MMLILINIDPSPPRRKKIIAEKDICLVRRSWEGMLWTPVLIAVFCWFFPQIFCCCGDCRPTINDNESGTFWSQCVDITLLNIVMLMMMMMMMMWLWQVKTKRQPKVNNQELVKTWYYQEHPWTPSICIRIASIKLWCRYAFFKLQELIES